MLFLYLIDSKIIDGKSDANVIFFFSVESNYLGFSLVVGWFSDFF